MTENRLLFQSGVATARQPRLLVAGAIGFIGKATKQLQLQGWEVVNVPTTDAVHAALTRKPTAMLLPEDTGAESGFLLAAKVLEAKRKLRVVLVGAKRTPEAERFAKFVGARFIAESEGVNKLLSVLES